MRGKKFFPLFFRGLIFFLFFNRISFAGFLEEKYFKDAILAVTNYKLLRIDREGEFKIYFINKYDFSLQNPRLEAKSEAFDIEISPLTLDKLIPENPTPFLLKLKLKDNYPAGNYNLDLNLWAKQGPEFKQGLKEIILIRDEEQGETHLLEGRRQGDAVIFPLGVLPVTVDETLTLKTISYFCIIIFLIFILIIRARFGK